MITDNVNIKMGVSPGPSEKEQREVFEDLRRMRKAIDSCTCGYQEHEGPPCTAVVHRVSNEGDKSMSRDIQEGTVKKGGQNSRPTTPRPPLPSSNKFNVSMSTAELPAPKGSGTPISEIVIRHIKQRSLMGTKKYGEPLMAHNGRDPMIDLYHELHDALVYTAQCLVEKYGEDFEI